MGRNNYSTFLFAVPTFSEGVGRLIDVGDTLTEYNYSPSAEGADRLAIAADWLAVGQDIQNAIPNSHK
jgi:hypothetical protein